MPNDILQGGDAQPDDFPIVALCASAGGLNAYEEFFDAMPPNSGIAFIVVQHLATQQESILHDLIQRHTRIAVQSIMDNCLVEPDNIYVLAAGYELEIWNRHLRLTPLIKMDGWPKTIDRFLKSLADDQGESASTVIFSGAGTDGVEGARAIHQVGGLVVAQDLETALQTSMPFSVIDAELAHVTLPPSLIPDALLNHFEIEIRPVTKFDDLDGMIQDDEIRQIIGHLRRQTNHDFTDYKTSFLRRQIARRLTLHQLENVSAYLDFMRQHPEEADRLVSHLLINVTNFFRDPEAFESLKTIALLPALKKLDLNVVFRVWVPGCASGEEAVSIAILIHECLRELDMRDMEVRIFATDMNRDLMKQARGGLYPRSIAHDVSPARLQDHFHEESDGYRVRNHISRMIIWSEHNLVEHPPFSNLHLISCRNVMIYFQRRLQERVMALFEFALKSGGILFLGSSETMPNSQDSFITLDLKNKIYQRAAGRKLPWMRFDQPFFLKVPDYLESFMPEDPQPKQDRVDRELETIKQMLIEHYNSTCAIVDESYQVRYTYGEIDRYLRIVPGREGQHNILDMAREGLDIELTIGLHQAFERDDEAEVTREGVWVKTNGDERIVNLLIKPIKNVGLRGRLRLVLFETVNKASQLRDPESISNHGEEGATIARLREELQQTQRALQSVTQALQAKSEELTSSMEEIRSANEEVQTTNEELRTSKEELESMNEELNTLNTQLTDQNYELTRANNTLHNFLQSSEIGMIFLDQSLAIREYTAAVTHIFGLRLGDMGRPLAEIASQIEYRDLQADAERVLDTLENIQTEVRAIDKRWYHLRIRPYRTTHNVIDGLVLTFSDISAQKQAQAAAEAYTVYVRQVFDTIEHSLIELDGKLRVIGVNRAFYEKFQVSEANTVGRLLYDLGDGEWNIPELRHLLTQIIPEQSAVHNFTVICDFPRVGIRTMHLNARQIAELDRILLVITDISEGQL